MNITQKEQQAFKRFLDHSEKDPYNKEKKGSIGLLLEQNAEKQPDKTALYYDGKSISYGDLNAGANRVSNFFLCS